MISKWFQEYKNLDEDIKEEYVHCYLSEEKKRLVLDYERFKEAVKAVSSGTDELILMYPDKERIADKIVQMFSYACTAFAPDLLLSKCIDDEMYSIVLNIDRHFKSLINEHNAEYWTTESMNSDQRWIKARELAAELLKLC